MNQEEKKFFSFFGRRKRLQLRFAAPNHVISSLERTFTFKIKFFFRPKVKNNYWLKSQHTENHSSLTKCIICFCIVPHLFCWFAYHTFAFEMLIMVSFHASCCERCQSYFVFSASVCCSTKCSDKATYARINFSSQKPISFRV